MPCPSFTRWHVARAVRPARALAGSLAGSAGATPVSHRVFALPPTRLEADCARLDGVRFRRNQNC